MGSQAAIVKYLVINIRINILFKIFFFTFHNILLLNSLTKI